MATWWAGELELAVNTTEMVEQIAYEVRDLFTIDKAQDYLDQFDVKRPRGGGWDSTYAYVKAALSTVHADDWPVLYKILGDLEIRGIFFGKPKPANWGDTSLFRLFISHLSKDKEEAWGVKACLEPYAILGFVAHEDIYPTLEWQQEIERALDSMDAFVALLTPGFSESVWTQQEIGVATGRGVKIISVRMGEDPTGFISKHQALAGAGRSAQEIAKQLDALLAKDRQTSFRSAVAKRVAKARKELGWD
jgi:hypothetical protein